MKKRIEHLLAGKFKYEPPQLVFSQDKIDMTAGAGETAQGELFLAALDERRIRGYVTSSDRRLVPGLEEFSGSAIRLPYGVDLNGLAPGDEVSGHLCFTTSIGEYRLPFRIEAAGESGTVSFRRVHSLKDFAALAKENFREAFRLFTDKGFATVLKDSEEKVKASFKGLSAQPVTYQSMEEFLITAGLKEKVSISLQEKETAVYNVRESVRNSIRIERNTWGHLRLEIEKSGDFLEVEKRVVTDEDFIGSSYSLDYIIRRDRLGKGNQFGRIRICSPYQELVYDITASRDIRLEGNIRREEQKQRLAVQKDFIDWRLGRLSTEHFADRALKKLEHVRDLGLSYPEYRLYEAYVLHVGRRNDDARRILADFQEKTFTREDLEMAGIYLYLCTVTGLYKERENALLRLQGFVSQKEDSILLRLALLELSPDREKRPVKVLYHLEEMFEKGCRSPLLYAEVWKCLRMDESLLRTLSPLMVQVFYFAAKQGCFSGELFMRFSYLTGYEKTFRELLYRTLCMNYERFPSDDALQEICRYIMLGNPRKKEYFRWYREAVEKGMRLTRLYEYYVETMDTSGERNLPKPLLMYFTYNNNTLGDTRKAFLYASVIERKNQEPEVYRKYEARIREFAEEKSREGKIGEDYAVIYQEFLKRPEEEAIIRNLAGQLFVYRLYCDNPRVRSVIVCHSQLQKEEIFSCNRGIAYPRIYTDDAVVLFQDEKLRRFESTVSYSLQKMLDESQYLEQLLKRGEQHPGLLLSYCEKKEVRKDNLAIFQAAALSEDFTEEYRGKIRRRILDYYRSHVHGENLDGYLRNLDYREFASVDKKELLEILVDRGLYPQAYQVIEDFGYEGLDDKAVLKLTSRMIVRRDMEEDEELLALASYVYRRGIYDEVILKYLMSFRYGPMDELFRIWKSAQGFELDTYDFEERILSLLMFTRDYRRDGEKVLEAYTRKSGKERITGAYLTHMAYGIFVKEYPMSEYIRKMLLHACQEEWPVNRICHYALFKAISGEKDPKNRYGELKKQLLLECVKENHYFAFFKRLPAVMLAPYQLDDKVFVEWHADPEAKVTLFYAMDTGLGRDITYIQKPLSPVYEGIYVKTFTLFYGETLHYYFRIEKDAAVQKTPERVITMNRAEGMPVSKYQQLNQILSARKLDKKNEAAMKLKQYLRQEQYVEEMFVLKTDEEKSGS